MKGENEIILKKNGRKAENRIKKDVFVFAFFLFLSFAFWYINSLEKSIEAEISYPFRYINLPREKLITVEQSVPLNLFLKGKGFSILTLKIAGGKNPLLIDISKISYKKLPGTNNLNYYILTSGLIKSFSSQIKSGCEITSVKPDTLFFTFEKAISKTSQLAPDLKVSNYRK